MTIHFVCAGNTYRSRLAEAYLKSKRLTNITVISSGIHASENIGRPISWLAQRLIETHKLTAFEKLVWTQTSKHILDRADITIFFEEAYYIECVRAYAFTSSSFEAWDISDVDSKVTDDMGKIQATEITFDMIRLKIDDLIMRKQL